MVISITRQHIYDAIEDSCSSCILGQALAPILNDHPNILDWAVLRTQVYIQLISDGTAHYFPLPKVASTNAKIFDKGGRDKVQPFSFELPIDELLNG